MKLSRLTCVLLLAAALIAAAAGCPRQEPDQTAMPDVPPTDQAPGPEAIAPVPESATTLSDAIAAFRRPASFEMTITEPDGQTSQTMAVKLDGTNPVAFKSETPEAIFLVSVPDKAMYRYDPKDNTALKMPLTEQGLGDYPNPYEFENPEAKMTGTETIGSVDCWVVEVTEGGGGKVWVGKADGLPRQMQQGEEITKLAYSRINEIPDSEFALPEGATVQEVPDIDMDTPGNASGAPGGTAGAGTARGGG